MCGADENIPVGSGNDSGSPPRVRSRHGVDDMVELIEGITSACAEQTTCMGGRLSATWDHLRVCGADSAVVIKPKGE